MIYKKYYSVFPLAIIFLNQISQMDHGPDADYLSVVIFLLHTKTSHRNSETTIEKMYPKQCIRVSAS